MIILILFIISQVLSYSPLEWCIFLSVALLAARTLGVGGVVLGHLVIAMIICYLDLRWIDAEMSKPGWNGTPDRDIGFIIGVIIRILLINTTLLPISFLSCRWHARRAERKFLPPRLMDAT